MVRRSSLRVRGVTEAGVAAALVCIVISVLFLLFVGSQESKLADDRATADWSLSVRLIKEQRLPAVLPDNRDGKVQAIQVLNAGNRVVAATPLLVGKPPITTLRPNHRMRSQRTLCSPVGLQGCMTVYSYKIVSQPGLNWLINVVVPVVPWYGNSTVLFLAIGVSLVTTAMMVAWAFRVVGKTLAPVDAIRTELAEITAAGQILRRRVPVPRNKDEIKFLAETVNATLGRLETTHEQLRRFTSDASHDLRSPIAAMRTQLEEALMHPQDADWPKVTEAVLAGMDRLQAIVTELLTLARLDARVPVTREVTDLAQLVGAELDRRTCRVQIVKDLRQNVLIDCDQLQIIRLLGNLLDNAERHATSRITVTVRANGGMATLEVIDDGAGIAVEHRERVFDRFTRLDASRSRDAAGTGLGLPIARQIAEAHGGTLTIEDSASGARFVLRCPRCREPHPFGADGAG